MSSPATPPPDIDSVRAQALAEAYFKGNLTFFWRFRQDCLRQFALDLAEGQRCAQARRLPGLMHLGHSLKTVLQLIGEDLLADCAQALERSARAQDPTASLQAWADLAAGLRRLLPPPAPDPGS